MAQFPDVDTVFAFSYFADVSGNLTLKTEIERFSEKPAKQVSTRWCHHPGV
jgi:hypothetical protein